MAEKNRTEAAGAEDALAVELLNSMGPAQDDPRSRTGRAGTGGEYGEGREAGEGAYLSNIHIGSSETPAGFGRGHADGGSDGDGAQPGLGGVAPRPAARADSAVAVSVDLPDIGLHADSPAAGGPTDGAGGGLAGLASALFEQVADLFRTGEPAPTASERGRVSHEEFPVETPETVAVKVAVKDDPPVEQQVDNTASAPTLAIEAVAGLEDGPISLNIASMLGDADGSETLSITVGGVPAGALLSAGIDNGDGSWTLAPSDLAGLTITPPADSDADFSLQITATSRESNGGITASTTAELAVTVNAVADAATLAVDDAAGLEDSAILLDIGSALADVDGSETLSIVIDGVPSGAVLSAGTDNGDGSWTLTPSDLAGLTVTPGPESDADFTLTVTATTTEGDNGNTEAVSASLDVTVNAAADAASLSVSNVAGSEDSAILLDIGSALADVDGSETLSITIDGVPSGAVLSAGTDNGSGSWTLAQGDLAGLTITPPANTDGDFTLTVTATTTEDENGNTGTVTDSFNVTVNAVADAATLETNDVTGSEDAAILLDIAGALTDIDGSETLSIVIDGMPAGAALSAGSDNGDGSWTLTPADITGLTITPPADSNADFTLTVTATTTEGENSDVETVVANLDVTVNAVADTVTLATNDVAGNEDSAILLDIASALTDVDGSETLGITIDGVPAGAVLSAGTDNGDGSWTLSAPQLAGLTVTPSADSDGDFTLTVTATTTEEANGGTETVTASIDVTVAAVADVATLATNDVIGAEDAAIPLDISSTLEDIDGSETLSVVIEGVPSGAALSAGTDNGDGSWTLSASQLAGLTVTPPADSDGDFALTVTTTTTEGENGDIQIVTANLDVTVNAVADTPTLTVNDVSASEDSAILLDISSTLADVDGSEALSITIDGVPPGAVLSAGTDNGDGSWTLAQADLAGLTVTPPTDTDGDFTLTVTAKATEGENGDIEIVTANFDVTVNAVADAATLSVDGVQGSEDSAILLDIASGLADIDGSETLSIVVGGVPSGAALSAGTDNGDGSWTLAPSDLAGLTITPGSNSDGDFTLTVTATTTEGENGDTETVTANFDVTVAAVADAATLAVADVSGGEDTAILLDIGSALADVDGSETLSIVVDGVPAGATLSAGTDNGDGSWTLSASQLAGLTVTPPAGSDVDFTLTVTATTIEDENGDSETVTASLDVTVNAVADAATLAVNDVAGSEDSAILLDIASSLTDMDGSETFGIVIDGVPAGAVLSAGTDNGDGSWTLTTSQLAGLTVTPPADSDGDFTLTVTAMTTEGGNGDTETVTASFDVTVNAVADAATMAVNDVTGSEDSAILLDIASAFADTDGSETLSITVDGVPAGAILSAGTDNGDGSWTLAPSDLAGLTVTPGPNSDGDFTLTVTATTTEGENGHTETVTANFDVTVSAVADAATLATNDVTGNEDSAILLDIASALTDVDGSETLGITIHGVPGGAVLSAGTDNGDGSWTLSAPQLAGLTVTPPADSDGDFTLTVTATTTEEANGGTETVTASIDVTVNAVADAPDLAVNDAAGFQDTGIALDISGALGDLDGSESLTFTVEGVPDGAALSAGTNNGDGSWTLTPGDLPGLTIAPPAGSVADFTLTVSATAEEGGSGDTATVSADIDISVHVDPSFESRFAASSDGFAYADDAFGTSNPGYASGAWQNQGGGDGALKVTLGGVNDNDVNGMSGAWERSFDLEAAGHVVLSFQYRMTMTSEYESDEFSTVLAAVDGALLGSGGNDYIDRLTGNGNGGSSVSTGWQVFTIDLGELDAGSHTLELGGFNNLKTLADESTEILFDNVTVNINGEEVLIGGSGNDSLAGNDGKDTLYGLDGNDTLSGGGGADYIYGGEGRDTLHGGDGNDVLSGGEDQDTLYGDAGNDILDGDGGNDALYGGDGDDTLFGDTGNDRLYGDAGDDAIFGGTGNDDFYGGDGNDTLDGGSGNDVLDGGAGDDAFIFGAGADSGWGGDGNDLLVLGNAGLLNNFDGGAGWTDTIRLEGVDSGPGLPLFADCTLLLTGGSIQGSNADSLDLSDDSAGVIIMSDGSELTFAGIEKIEW